MGINILIAIHLIPALIGCCVGRWFPVWLRLVPSVLISSYGVLDVLGAGHDFRCVFLPLVICYIVGLFVGLALKAKAKKLKICEIYHFDCICLVVVIAVLWLMYPNLLIMY